VVEKVAVGEFFLLAVPCSLPVTFHQPCKILSTGAFVKRHTWRTLHITVISVVSCRVRHDSSFTVIWSFRIRRYGTTLCNTTLWYNTVQPYTMIQHCATPHCDTTLCNPTLWYITLCNPHTMIQHSATPHYDTTLCNPTLWYSTLHPHTMIQHCATPHYDSTLCNPLQANCYSFSCTLIRQCWGTCCRGTGVGVDPPLRAGVSTNFSGWESRLFLIPLRLEFFRSRPSVRLVFFFPCLLCSLLPLLQSIIPNTARSPFCPFYVYCFY